MASVETSSPTPILDLESPLPLPHRRERRNWRQTLLAGVLSIAAVILTVAAVEWLRENNGTIDTIFSDLGAKVDTLSLPAANILILVCLVFCFSVVYIFVLLAFPSNRLKVRRWRYLLALNRQIVAGVHPKTLERSRIDQCCAVNDESPAAFVAFFMAYAAAVGRGETQSALVYLEKCLERFGVIRVEWQNQILVEAVVFHAWFREDQRKAAIWAQRLEKSNVLPPLQQLRLAICMHWVAHQYDALPSEWEQARVHIEALPDSPEKTNLRDDWLEWKNEIAKRRIAGEILPESQ
jgi:hypothetical protein